MSGISETGPNKKTSGSRRRAPAIYALEPRVMYDGAGAASAHHHFADHHFGPGQGPFAAGDHHPLAAPAAETTWTRATTSVSSGNGRGAADRATDTSTAKTTGLGAGDTVVFVDSQIANYQAIVAAINPGVKVIVYDGTKDGLAQIARDLHGVQGLAAVDIISTGSMDTVQIGTDTLTTSTIPTYAADLAAVGKALAPNGQLELYGGDVAAAGDGFLAAMQQATGHTVSAATTPVGGTAAGGTWTLDASTGATADALPADLTAIQSFDGLLAPTAQIAVAADPALDNGNLEIAFIDASLANYQALIGDVRPGVEVVVIFGQDGLEQIANFLQGQTGVDAIHIISHGSSGDIDFGGENLTTGDIASYQATLAAIGNSLVPGGDILIYGCDVAAGPSGETLIEQIASYTHDNVAAATGLVGAASLGGSWDLDFQVGTIDVATAINATSGANFKSVLTTYAFTDGGASASGFAGSTVKTTYSDLTLKETDGSQALGQAEFPYMYSDPTLGVIGTGNYAFATETLDITKTNNASFDAASLYIFGGAGTTYLGGGSGGTAQQDGVNGYDLVIDGYNSSGVETGTDTIHIANTATSPVSVNLTGVTGFTDITDLRVSAEDFVSVKDLVLDPAVPPGPAVTAGATASFTGGGSAVALDSGLTVTDPNSTTLADATVSIGSGFLSGDRLNFTNQNGISGSYNASTGVLTLTGSATLAQYQTALESITFSFSPGNGDPTNGGADTTRTLDWVVYDGTASSTQVTSTIDTVHAAPSVTAGSTATFDGGGSAVALDATLTASDADSSGDLASATVSIGTGFTSGDTLNFTNQHGITGSYNASTGVLTLTGTTTIANYETALDSITYSFTANGDPTAGGTHTSRTIDWRVNDGTASSTQVTSTLDTVHVAPSVTAGATATFEHAGSATALDSALTLSDVDSGGNLASATVSIGTGFTSGDALSFTNQNGITGSYNSATGVLTLTGTTTVANYQAALGSIAFSTTVNTAGSRTIDWLVNDGVAASSQVTSSVTVETGPQITAGATATFTGGGSAVAPDGALTLSDAASTTLASATVSIGTGFISGDTLNFTNQLGITGSYNASTGVLTLTGTTTVANYQTALDSITYSFTANGDPTGGGTHTSRTIDWQVNDGTASSTQVTSTLDTAHAAPSLTAGATVTFVHGGAATALDSTLTASDADSGGNLTGATVSIGTGFTSGDTLSFTNQNGITGSYNSATGVLTLTGTTTIANYQAALDSIAFSTTVSTVGSRTIDWTVNDGVASSSQATSAVNVEVGPQVTAGATATFTGGGSAVALDSGLALSDSASTTLASATVSIGTGFISGDTLSFTNQNGITGSYNGSTGVLTLTGTASLANYQTALDSVTYAFTPGNGDPTGGGTHTGRTIDWVANDGSNSNVAVTSTLDTVHAAPTLSTSGTVTFVQGGSATTLDGSVSLSDPDSGGLLTSATVSIGTGFLNGDTLSASTTGLPSITASYNSSTGVLTLSGSDTLADYQAVLRSVAFSSSSGNPTNSGADLSRTIAWSINDGASANTGPETSTVDVHAMPAVVAGSTVTFTGGGSAVALDSGLTVGDFSSTTLAGATVSIGTGFISGDALNFANQNGITGSYNAATGVLTLNGTATLAHYQTALESITYSFAANGDPTGGGADTSRTISFVVNDGTTSSTAATSTVDTSHVAPSVTAGSTVTFTGGGSAVALDSALTASDVDSGGNLTGATVSIGTGHLGGDTLSFSNQNGISGSFNSATGVLTLSGTATIANYQAALDSITFGFTANGDPTNGGGDTSRTIHWVVNDGVANSSAGTSTLDTVHAAPSVTAGATATFTGGGSAVALDGALTASDADSGGNLASATVSIGTGYLSGDTLSFTNQNGISGSYNNSTGVLVLTGTATVANYQTALESITYSFSGNGDPTNGGGDTNRTLHWVVNDGVSNSTAASSTVDVVHAPASVAAGATAAFEHNGSAAILDGTLTVSDADSGGTLTGATVSIGAGFTSGDTLSFSNQNGITGSYNSATGVLTLTGTASVADYQAAFESIAFSTPVDVQGSRTIGWVANDGLANSIQATSIVNVETGPQLTAGATSTFTGAGPAALDSTLTVTDAAGPTLANATVSISAGFLSGDLLNFTNQNGITGNYNSATGVLTLTGTASVANYQTALDSITYSFAPINGDPSNNGADPTRTISWVANDAVTSSTATSTLGVNHTAPNIVAGASVNYDANQSTPAPLDPALAVSDVDSATLSSATVTISGGLAAGDVLHFTNQNGITGSYDATSGTLTLAGTASLAAYQNALESVSFTSTTPQSGPRTITWQVNDGAPVHGSSAPRTSTVNVTGVLPPPPLTPSAPPPAPPPSFVPPPPPPSSHTATLVVDVAPPNSDGGNGTEIVPVSFLPPNLQNAASNGDVFFVNADAEVLSDHGAEIRFEVPLSNLETPLSGNITSIAAEQSDGNPLPSWLSFNPKTGIFTGTVPAGETGTVTVDVVVKDGNGNTSVTSLTIDLSAVAGHRAAIVPGQHRSALPPAEKLGLAEPGDRHADRNLPHAARNRLVAAAHPRPHGRAGLREQMSSVGWLAMGGQRAGLLHSIRQIWG